MGSKLKKLQNPGDLLVVSKTLDPKGLHWGLGQRYGNT